MRFEQCRDGRRWPLETPLRLRSFRGDQRVGFFHLPLGHDAGEAFETINADPVPAGDRAVPFKVGETLTYDISWSGALTAGTATMTVKERRPFGAGAIYDLIAEGKPGPTLDKLYHLYYKAESFLETKSLQL